MGRRLKASTNPQTAPTKAPVDTYRLHPALLEYVSDLRTVEVVACNPDGLITGIVIRNRPAG